ncbi:uncharacterized protein [Nicotiana sylvestris]|uniref:uncharacterized protein isoform X5 n=1 Tax=Nicotiana sylvestris TaxID=4096 RepID=UPI00388C8B92
MMSLENCKILLGLTDKSAFTFTQRSFFPTRVLYINSSGTLFAGGCIAICQIRVVRRWKLREKRRLRLEFGRGIEVWIYVPGLEHDRYPRAIAFRSYLRRHFIF